jgi:hypothetical protein
MVGVFCRIKLLKMPNHKKTQSTFSPDLDMTSRVALVTSAYLTRGHINRQLLVETYGVTQVQAGRLMRDFIEAHSKTIEWFPKNTHYRLIDKK